MEDNNNYTYTYRREKKKEQQKLRLIVLIVFCILALICIIAGIISGRKSAEKARENELSASASLAESTSTEEVPTEETSPYKTGDYTVETGGYSLKFREDHTTDSKVYLEIKDTTKLTIDEIYHDEAVGTSGSGIEYWGKTTYKGYTGWVAMNYLKKAYSDNIVTPDEMTSTEESTTAAPENTTAAPTTTEPTTEKPTEATTAEPTTAATQDTTAAPATDESTTAATSVGGYTPGDYVVNTGDYTLTFRKSASRSGDVIFGIENGVKLTVTKIVETTDAQSDYRYWGEVTYKGQTGYVSMAYLKKAN